MYVNGVYLVTAKPTTGSATGINPIEKIRQQNIDEELDLEGKQTNKIT